MPPRVSLATIEEDFHEIDQLLKALRKRIALAAETIRITATVRKMRVPEAASVKRRRRKRT